MFVEFFICLSLSLSSLQLPKGTLTLEAQDDVDHQIRALLKEGKKGSLAPLHVLEKGSPLLLSWAPVYEPHPSFTRPPASPLSASKKPQKRAAVTYNFSGGRLGDNLIAYFHGKWIAREFGLPFLYKPFKHSDCFKLDEMDQKFGPSFKFSKTVTFSDKGDLSRLKESSLLTVPYFSECRYEIVHSPWNHWPYFVIDWDDPLFRQEAILALTPKKTIHTLDLPEGYLTVALHIRRGGSYESCAEGMRNYPLKFPTDSYYIEQLRRIANIFENMPMYVHLFTDDLHPERIAKHYASILQNPHMQFGWNPPSLPQGSDEELLHDFYSIGKFDCLVLCQSHFSLMASVLGNFTIMITPLDCIFDGNQFIVDQVETRFKAKAQ